MYGPERKCVAVESQNLQVIGSNRNLSRKNLS
jgi:hypothetical protein